MFCRKIEQAYTWTCLERRDMEHIVVGLDIGGTAVKGALLNTAGEIVRKDVIDTCHDAGVLGAGFMALDHLERV